MTGTYHIWPVSIGVILAYLFSLGAVQLGIYRRGTHHRIWNVLLLLNFLATALIGILLTLQVNYKFPLAGEDTWMLIHVDTGIAMTVIVFFHLGWHWGYFRSYFRKSHTAPFPAPDDVPEGRILPATVGRMFPLFALGFTAMITQLVLLRAFLSVFHGNELVIGIILGNWMLLTALGSRAGRAAPRARTPQRLFPSLLLWLGTIPLLTLFLLFLLKNQVFVPGTLAGLPEIFLASLVLMFPFCFLSGYSFSFFTWYLFRQGDPSLTTVSYSWESAGSLAGGFLFSFILVFFLDPFRSLAVVLLFDLTVFAWMVRKEGFLPRRLLPLFFLLAAGLAPFLFPVDKAALHFLYPHQQILEHRESPFGSLVVTRMGDQLNLYEDHTLVAHTLDVVSREEDVHYAMVQRQAPARVLLISGGIAGTLQEILKYPSVQEVDYVEIDPAIIRLGKKYFPFPDDPRVRVIIRDARRYLNRSDKKYDIILVNVPPPATAQVNRYYTLEFFRTVAASLRDSGVVSLRLPASQNYLGEAESDITALMWNTLRKVFPHVVIVPGEKNYFLASDAPLSLEIARLVTERGIQNQYVSPWYLQDDLLKMRSRMILSRLQEGGEINRDNDPVAYFRQIAVWLSYYRTDTRIFVALLLGLFLWFFVRTGAHGRVIFAGGLAAASAEVLLLFLFETIYGYLYLMTGMLVTLFMAGIAGGAYVWRRGTFPPGPPSLYRSALWLAGGILFLPGLTWLLHQLATLPLTGEILILLYAFALGWSTGRLFRAASHMQKGDVARVSSSLYSADLAGGALGAFTVATLTLPITGLTGTVLLTAILLFLTLAISYMSRKR